ncbi:MAG: CRISPR-associated protein Cas4 [Anaerolineales bacterium]|nr:CRISPR-associated protein Cas4 [Anaerolineales bacterium]
MTAGILALLVLAVLFLLLSGRLRQTAGLPAGEVVSTDTGAWGRVDRPLVSERLQLTGKPDYLVRAGAELIPVEVKSGRAPAAGAYPGHVYQLAAYCALVTETYGRRPRYGLIKYADQTRRIEYSPALERDLLAVLAAMRAAGDAEDVARSHASAGRCAACGLRAECDQRLA